MAILSREEILVQAEAYFNALAEKEPWHAQQLLGCHARNMAAIEAGCCQHSFLIADRSSNQCIKCGEIEPRAADRMTIEEVRERFDRHHEQYPWPGGMTVQIDHYNTLVQQSELTNEWRLRAESAEKRLADRDASLFRATGRK